jgi:hypothetical protein
MLQLMNWITNSSSMNLPDIFRSEFLMIMPFDSCLSDFALNHIMARTKRLLEVVRVGMVDLMLVILFEFELFSTLTPVFVARASWWI